MSNEPWKEKLAGRIPENLAKEIDLFEAQIALRKLGKIDEKVFAETRLRRGAYGQRYDNGHRHDGIATQDFGRKFKIAFSGCKSEACALISMHDLGGIAATREVNGKLQRGFELYVGGGLGAVPHQAKLFSEFLPAEELLPLARAIGRVFARLGEKKNRNKARLKFVVAKLGIDEFRRVVLEERATMPDDPGWRKYF